MKKINLLQNADELRRLKAGEHAFLSGIIYTARDQAHKRLVSAKRMPVDLKGAVIYYCGPTPARRGRVIGSAGPTTSSRMDKFTPVLLKRGLLAMIGKGRRSDEVRRAIKRYRGVYLLTYAGCGALLTKYIKKAKPAAYKELGPEAVYKLEIRDLPVIVGIDAKGRSIYG